VCLGNEQKIYGLVKGEGSKMFIFFENDQTNARHLRDICKRKNGQFLTAGQLFFYETPVLSPVRR